MKPLPEIPENCSTESKVWLSGIGVSVMYERQRLITAQYMAIITGICAVSSGVNGWSEDSWFYAFIASLNAIICAWQTELCFKISKKIKHMEAYFCTAIEGVNLMNKDLLTPAMIETLEERAQASCESILGKDKEDEKDTE